MSMFFASLLLGSTPVIGTVPVRNDELDAAHICLTSGTSKFLKDVAAKPASNERWQWAMKIVDRCDAKIETAALSRESQSIPGDILPNGLTKHDALRSEAAYFVDSLIRDHFDKLEGTSR